jgi:hypothetical protein
MKTYTLKNEATNEEILKLIKKINQENPRGDTRVELCLLSGPFGDIFGGPFWEDTVWSIVRALRLCVK